MFRSLCCDSIATIQHFLTLSTHPLSLTLLPIRHVCCNDIATMPIPWAYRIRKLPCPSGSTYGLNTVLSTPSVFGLFRCCLFAGFIMSMVCLLAGIVTTRPSAFAEGEGFEPPPRLAVLPALSTFPLIQPSFAVVPCVFPKGQFFGALTSPFSFPS